MVDFSGAVPKARADAQPCPWQPWQPRVRRAQCHRQSASAGHDAPVVAVTVAQRQSADLAARPPDCVLAEALCPAHAPPQSQSAVVSASIGAGILLDGRRRLP